MALDATARESNLLDSLKKYFVDNLETSEGIPVSFDVSLSVPTLQGTAVDKWYAIGFGALDMETLSSFVVNIFCCTRQDAEGFKRAQLRDTAYEYLIDETQTDGMARIPFYRSRAVGAWTNIGSLVVQEIIESGHMEAPDESKYKILTVIMRFGSKV